MVFYLHNKKILTNSENMNLYSWITLFSFALLFFLFYLRSGVRKKYSQKAWIERLETIARDNHTLWITQVPYPLRLQVCRELTALEKEQRKKGSLLHLSESGEWSSPRDLLKYPYIKRLFKKLVPQITAYSMTLGVNPKRLTLSAWAHISRNSPDAPKDLQEDALFSGCYFLEEGREDKESSISFYKKGGNSLLAKLLPHPGDLHLYPSDMTQNMESYSSQNERICLYFNVHFGNRKKSWFITKVQDTEKMKKLDPFYEKRAEFNKPISSEKLGLKPMLVHISKLKRRLFK